MYSKDDYVQQRTVQRDYDIVHITYRGAELSLPYTLHNYLVFATVRWHRDFRTAATLRRDNTSHHEAAVRYRTHHVLRRRG